MDDKEFSVQLSAIHSRLSKIRKEELGQEDVEEEEVKPAPKVDENEKMDHDIMVMKSKINQMIHSRNKKTTVSDKELHEQIKSVDIHTTSPDVFNTETKTKKVLWSHLKPDIKIEKLDEFFNAVLYEKVDKSNDNVMSKMISLRDELVEMIKTKKLNTQKEVMYDGVNGKVKNLLVIEFLPEEKVFAMKDLSISLQKKNQKKVSKIVKK